MHTVVMQNHKTTKFNVSAADFEPHNIVVHHGSDTDSDWCPGTDVGDESDCSQASFIIPLQSHAGELSYTMIDALPVAIYCI